ncbi:MAG: CopG family transcriptional regulator [Actinomycetota bacterium]|nr:CopG family transcriptional regulator [Actinomycetota bacterium]
MAKTTLYLPDDLKRAIELEARRRAIPEAEVVRQALRDALSGNTVRPRGALFSGSEPIADRVDGFGER